jgi:hypothetical protein
MRWCTRIGGADKYILVSFKKVWITNADIPGKMIGGAMFFEAMSCAGGIEPV